jgi:hypothetical protein
LLVRENGRAGYDSKTLDVVQRMACWLAKMLCWSRDGPADRW